MQALVLKNQQLSYVNDHRFSNIPNEVTIRLIQGGICATDIELQKGYMNFNGVIGHEWIGEVISAPDSSWHFSSSFQIFVLSFVMT